MVLHGSMVSHIYLLTEKYDQLLSQPDTLQPTLIEYYFWEYIFASLLA